ncbi:MAG: hypothetical protein LVR00_03270 [Rhabdochlamydiaceae bacterium]|jgi:acetyl-CoA carboxylase biotin carboxylase subunit
MIAKLIIRGKNRTEAIAIAKRALKEFYIGGVHSTIPFHLHMLNDKKFLESDYCITYIDELIAAGYIFNDPKD